jgi:two-component system response regulator
MGTTSTPELALVEDNSYDEELTIAGIRKSGVACNVTVRRDGAEALEFLLGAPVPPSLILLDYKLPKMNGLEVLTQLKLVDRTRFVPVVIFSGTNVGNAIKDCYRVGANSCVTKPDDASEYVGLVRWITHYWLNVNRRSEDVSGLLSRRISNGPFEPII